MDDFGIWSPSYAGNFTLFSAWQLIRKKNPCSFIARSCWFKYLPSKISIFLWKLRHNAIPTDLVLRKKGILITSKCLCCTLTYSIEFNTHLLLSSEYASSIWGFYSSSFNIGESFLIINHVIVH